MEILDKLPERNASLTGALTRQQKYEAAGELECKVCKCKFPLNFFNKRSDSAGGGLRSECKPCQRKFNIKYTYGIEWDEYERLWVEQNGACAICKENAMLMDLLALRNALQVDHDHTTGKVRGLLCHRCNKGIGLLRESADIAMSAFDYLSAAAKIKPVEETHE